MVNQEERLSQIALEIKAGDLSHFEELYNATKKPVFFSAYAIIKDKDQIADLMQETYEDFLLSAKDKFRSGEKVTPYLIGIIHHKAVDLAEGNQRLVPLEPFLEKDEEDGEEETHEEDGKLFQLAKKALSEDEYQIIILHVIDDLKFKAIAKMMNKPLGTVLWLYNKAMKTLQKKTEGWK
ncbi:MAG: RNA polymerase sigma factor [Bacilli bacterium]|jgi:RNA polymerase sigma-70 factor (ECF subfamily)|nr:RNA polymerase sigma factor [Bacilli bacterium]